MSNNSLIDYIRQVKQFFKYDHLPQNIQEPSRRCSELADNMIEMCGFCCDNRELLKGLDKLIEAKDCFVRAKIIHNENVSKIGPT